MKLKKPAVTIYMPVFNAAEFLPQAIESILNQTFANFEFIIIDDASTDSSWRIIKFYAKKDKRILAFKNPINLGVSLTSNIAISKAKTKFLARMDADDIATSNRIEKQLNYLKTHPQTVVVGGQCTIIDQNNAVIGFKKFPTKTRKIRNMIFWAVPIQQGYMMVNLSKLPKNFAWYSPSQTSAEEVDLYFDLLKYGQFANLPDNLYFYRQISTSLSHLNPKKTFLITLQSRIKAIKNGYYPSFSAILLNLIQITTVLLLPNSAINTLWYFIRGIKRFNFSQSSVSQALKV